MPPSLLLLATLSAIAFAAPQPTPSRGASAVAQPPSIVQPLLSSPGEPGFRPLSKPSPAKAISAKLHHGEPRSHRKIHRVRRRNTNGATNSISSAASANGALFKTGQSYTLVARPGYLTTVVLAPGEKIISRASGDTARWALGETVEGAGETARPIVLLRPRKPGLRTNIVLATDHRTYLLKVHSEETQKFTEVFSWTYGETTNSSSRLTEAAIVGLDPKVPRSAALTFPFTHLNMGYRVVPISRSHAPSWRPKRVFDDGSRTYIEFPIRLPQYIAPPLFSIDATDKFELVNYHVIKNYYIVDRILDKARLVYGEKKQDAVTIERVKEND